MYKLTFISRPSDVKVHVGMFLRNRINSLAVEVSVMGYIYALKVTSLH